MSRALPSRNNNNNATPAASSMGAGTESTAVPTLRVMRFQSPELHCQVADAVSASSPSNAMQSVLHTSLCLPDSLTVYVGESFTAYLGVLNSSKHVPIRRLTVSAQLQTPSQRYQLPSTTFDQGNLSGGMDVEPESSIDAIVSRVIEESGQHMLRVEVGYLTPEGGTQTFRKFYRFVVLSPFKVYDKVVRMGDTRCLVSVTVEYPKNDEEKQDMMVIAATNFEPANGFMATAVGCTSSFGASPTDDTSETSMQEQQQQLTAVQLWDSTGAIHPGSALAYMFSIEAVTSDALLRGIAAGDYLGRAVITWRKAMGETGVMCSNSISCPKVEPFGNKQHDFVVHRSGWTVDVAAASASGVQPTQQYTTDKDRTNTDVVVVTVEPIDPPSSVVLHKPIRVQFLVVNHSQTKLTLQLQFAVSQMDPGLVVSGSSFQNLGEIPGQGGSAVVDMTFLPLSAGLRRVQGCTILDLASGREMNQPPLFHTFVQLEASHNDQKDAASSTLSPLPSKPVEA